MTRLDALKQVLAKPPETADDEKIGHVYRWREPAEKVTPKPTTWWLTGSHWIKRSA